MNKVAALRMKRGLTQVQLAAVLGITKDYVSIIERGSQTPGLKLANKIATFFDTTIDDLVFFTHTPNDSFVTSMLDKEGRV